jgi:hypothetical protein
LGVDLQPAKIARQRAKAVDDGRLAAGKMQDAAHLPLSGATGACPGHRERRLDGDGRQQQITRWVRGGSGGQQIKAELIDGLSYIGGLSLGAKCDHTQHGNGRKQLHGD